MFQSSHNIMTPIAIGNFFFGHPSAMTLASASVHNMLLKFDSEICFFSLNDQIWPDFDQEPVCKATGNNPSMQRSMGRLARLSGGFKVSSKPLVDKSNRSGISHIDPSIDDKTNMASFLGGIEVNPGIMPFSMFTSKGLTFDTNKSFSVEQAGNVINIDQCFILLKVFDAKVAKSGDLRCPVRKDAEGQSRAKQEQCAPGVCNEHGLPPKGMMCSDLTGNCERSAEMTDQYMVSIIPYI